jgi:NitT/TauT family transport system substrate-binding protein
VTDPKSNSTGSQPNPPGHAKEKEEQMIDRRSVLALCIAALAVISGVSDAGAAEKLKLTLNWAVGPYHEAFYLAQARGYYAAEGVEVEIEPGRGSGATIQLVASGRTDIGIAGGVAAFDLAAKGAPVKVVMALRQDDGYAVLVRPGSGIKTPKDLEGKRIALQPGGIQVPLFDAFVAVNKLDKSKIQVTSVDASALLNLYAENRIDAYITIPGFEAPKLAERGLKAEYVSLRAYGVPILGHSLTVSQRTLDQRPAAIRGFLKATLRAFGESVKDPGAAVDALLAANPNAGKREEILFTVKDAIETTYCTPGAPGLGWPSQKILDESFAVMTGYMNLPKDKPISFYATREFLPAALPACP